MGHPRFPPPTRGISNTLPPVRCVGGGGGGGNVHNTLRKAWEVGEEAGGRGRGVESPLRMLSAHCRCAAGTAGSQKPGLLQTDEDTNQMTKKQCPVIF